MKQLLDDFFNYYTIFLCLSAWMVILMWINFPILNIRRWHGFPPIVK